MKKSYKKQNLNYNFSFIIRKSKSLFIYTKIIIKIN